MEIKNWIEWIKQMSKIWEKIWTQTYCKFLLLPFDCEPQSGPENQMGREMSSHCDKNLAHNAGGKYRLIPLLSSNVNENVVFDLRALSFTTELTLACIVALILDQAPVYLFLPAPHG